MKRYVYVCLIFSLLLAGCSWFKSNTELTADELAANGMEYFQDGKYKQAIESFQQLKDWYPFSKYAILAELKIGDAHFHLQQYEDAIFAYEEFESLHPRNEAIPYVIMAAVILVVISLVPALSTFLPIQAGLYNP